MTVAATRMSKLRILCLHGFTSNGAVHAHQMRKITAPLSAEFEFIFPDGPHGVDVDSQMDLSKPATKMWADYVAENSKAGHRAWWFAREGNWHNKETGGFFGLEKSLQHLGEVLDKEGPVHAICGFSQGACLAGMLIALLSDKNVEHPLRKLLGSKQGSPMAGMFFSGFKARFAQYDSIYEPGISVPTLHVMGENDQLVSRLRSESLLQVCEGARLFEHAGGHDIPKSEEDREHCVQFLRQTLSGKTVA